MPHTPNPLVEVAEWVWSQLRDDLTNLEPEEIDWRPLPQSNSLNTIVRHLRIEAEWQVTSLESAHAMPGETTAAIQAFVDSVPFDFDRNLKDLESLCVRYLAILRTIPIEKLEERSRLVYSGFPGQASSPRFLGYHHSLHLAMHWGQIRSLRNLYRTSRGQPARFFPENPSFPKPASL